MAEPPASKRGKLAVNDRDDLSQHQDSRPLNQGALYPLFNALCQASSAEDRLNRISELRILYAYAYYFANRGQFTTPYEVEDYLRDTDPIYQNAAASEKATEDLCTAVRQLMKRAFTGNSGDFAVLPPELLQEIMQRLPLAGKLAFRGTQRHLLWNVGPSEVPTMWQYYLPVLKVLGWDTMGLAEFTRRVREYPTLRTILYYIACLWTTEWHLWRKGEWRNRPVGPDNNPLAEVLVVPPILETLGPDASARVPVPSPTAEMNVFLQSMEARMRQGSLSARMTRALIYNPDGLEMWGRGRQPTKQIGATAHYTFITAISGPPVANPMDPSSYEPRLVLYRWVTMFEMLQQIMGLAHPLLPLMLLTLLPKNMYKTLIDPLTQSHRPFILHCNYDFMPMGPITEFIPSPDTYGVTMKEYMTMIALHLRELERQKESGEGEFMLRVLYFSPAQVGVYIVV